MVRWMKSLRKAPRGSRSGWRTTPQRNSHVGFVHQYRPLGEEELRFVLTHKWAELGLSFSPDDHTAAEAMAAIARITGGNIRLVQRLFAQIERILQINALQTIT